MGSLDSGRGDESAGKDEIDITGGEASGVKPRGRDRRNDLGSLFGGYQGPERRSGRDRRSNA